MKDQVKMKGSFILTLIRDGKKVDERKVENVVTNTGLAEVAGLVGDSGSPTAFTYLAVGTGTTAAGATDTALEAEITDSGLERSASTVSLETTTVTDDTLQLLKSWTASGAKAVTECGALNAGAVGVLLGHQVFSAINVTSGDTLQLTYRFAFA